VRSKKIYVDAEFVEPDGAGEEGGGTAVASGGYPVAG